jgi:hypothetical protein
MSREFGVRSQESEEELKFKDTGLMFKVKVNSKFKGNCF